MVARIQTETAPSGLARGPLTRLAVPIIALAGALAQTAYVWRGIERARAFAAEGRRYQRRVSTPVLRILILGDSTGVGIGATCREDSIAGLLATEFPQADIVNVSQSGARVAHVARQARRCIRVGWHFDLALVHVGGNDVLRATPIDRLVIASQHLMTELGSLADRTVWLGPLNIGLAPLFPPPYSWLLAARSHAAARVFAACAQAHDAQFIDFCAADHSDHFLRERRASFAVDGLHPSSSAYRYGYAALRAAMQRQEEATLPTSHPADIPVPARSSTSAKGVAWRSRSKQWIATLR
jgi:lysophospholipase L1-like esterase